MSNFSSPSSIEQLSDCLLDLTQPIAKRTHAAFHLRTIGTPECVLIIAEAIKQKADTELMRHELGYILGQMGDRSICAVLASILDDEDDNLLVRHECAEALGAIGDQTYNDILLKHSTHEAPEVAETCQIALELIEWRNKEENVEKSLYLSVDPAPPFANNISIEELTNILIDQSLSLFKRYRAMFSLRNINNDKAALALLEGFNDDSSALFRHEIAYILGQMQRSVTIDGLTKVLENKIEHKMVRHEAAEALGAIGGIKVEEILSNFTSNDDEVVTQSCEVALNNIEYWQEIDTTIN